MDEQEFCERLSEAEDQLNDWVGFGPRTFTAEQWALCVAYERLTQAHVEHKRTLRLRYVEESALERATWEGGLESAWPAWQAARNAHRVAAEKAAEAQAEWLRLLGVVDDDFAPAWEKIEGVLKLMA